MHSGTEEIRGRLSTVEEFEEFYAQTAARLTGRLYVMLGDLAEAQIAAGTGLSASTAKTHLARGRTALADRMDDPRSEEASGRARAAGARVIGGGPGRVRCRGAAPCNRGGRRAPGPAPRPPAAAVRRGRAGVCAGPPHGGHVGVDAALRLVDAAGPDRRRAPPPAARPGRHGARIGDHPGRRGARRGRAVAERDLRLGRAACCPRTPDPRWPRRWPTWRSSPADRSSR